jgi:hypothetical protein
LDRVNYVDKAKRLMMQTARAGALLIVPLAAAVAPAHGGVVLPSTTTSCEASSNAESFSCSGGVSVSTLSGSALSGIQFTSISGGTSFLEASGGANAVNTIATGGTLTGGSLSGSIPVNFSFAGFAETGDFNVSGSWIVEFELGSSGGASNYGSVSFSGGISSPTAPSGSGSGSLAVNGTVTSGSALFESVVVTLPTSGFSEVLITYPFSFESVNATGVPEPASVGMFAAGLGLFGWLLRRRRVKKS